MTTAIFKFKSDSVSGDQFSVVGFNGHEAISTLYRYEIEIKAPRSASIDLDDVLDARATFTIEQNGIESPVHGVLSSFEEIRFAQNYCYYKAILVPEVWKLTNYKTNEIYYQTGSGVLGDSGQTIVDIIHQVFEHAGIASSEYDISSLQGKLLKREYVCQFSESDFDFVSRLLENEGVFYYFEQDASSEKIIFINDLNYLTIPRPKLIFDVTAQVKNQDDCVYGLSCRKQRLPEKVIVRDYNTDEPSLDVSEVTSIDTMGQGTEYIYGKNVHSDTEAAYLSQIRAEEYICRKTQYFGESSVPRLMAGYIFVIEGHPNSVYNSVEYLALEVTHEGESLDMSLSGGQSVSKPQYRNSFTAIPAEIQYRPDRKTIKPKITGTLHARIDGELDSEFAQLDEEGRYKVSLPFDFHNENHPEGLASARVRMMQPYAGKNRGMQFPMAKGTEVLLSFVDGDPDRPIIAGAINTATTPGPVSAENQTESVIQTGGNNKVRFEDEKGFERIIMESPSSNSWLRIGAPNDPISDPIDFDGDGNNEIEYASNGIRIKTDGGLWMESLDRYGEFIAGSPTDATTDSTDFDYSRNPTNQALLSHFGSGYAPKGIEPRFAGDPDSDAEDFNSVINKARVIVSSLDTVTTQEGNIYDFGGYWNYNLGNSYTENHIDQSPMLNDDEPDAASATNTHNDELQQLEEELENLKSRESNLETSYAFEEVLHFDMDGDGNTTVDAGLNSVAAEITTKETAIEAKKLAKPLRPVHDLFNTGGPGWTSINWPSSSPDGLSADDVKLDDPFYEQTSMNMWADKSFGNSYDYKNGDGISVTVGSSLDVQHGGRHVELGYRGDGSISSWSHSENGVSREKKWTSAGTLIYESRTESTAKNINELEKKFDRNTGDVYSHTHSQGTGMGLTKFEFDYSNTLSMTINSGSLLSSETHLGARITNDNFLGLLMELKMFSGMKCEFHVGLGGIIETKNSQAEICFPGMKLEGGVAEVKTVASAIELVGSTVKSMATGVQANAIKIKSGGLDMTA
jgi:type VI secretion system VgrG family protein